MIFYLIYLSSAKQLYTTSDLSDILLKSRLNNTSKNVTGLLLYHEGSILQILEGNKETVQTLYDTIERDTRHHNIIKMVTGLTDQRNFLDWSMGFKTVTDAEWKKLAGFFKLESSLLLSHLKDSNRKINTMVNSYMSVNFRSEIVAHDLKNQ